MRQNNDLPYHLLVCNSHYEFGNLFCCTTLQTQSIKACNSKYVKGQGLLTKIYSLLAKAGFFTLEKATLKYLIIVKYLVKNKKGNLFEMFQICNNKLYRQLPRGICHCSLNCL